MRLVPRTGHLAQAALLLGWLAVLAPGCSPSPTEYQLQYAWASNVYGRGEYLAAYRAWRRAEELAETDRDRIEARYRAAKSLERGGEKEQARDELLALAEQWPRSERAARSLADAAELSLELGQEARAIELYERVFRDYQSSGLLPQGAMRLLELVAPTPEARVARIDSMLKQELAEEVDEALRFDRAETLEALGRDDEALSAFDDLARRYPYPYGGYWDDALMRAATIDLRRGNAEGALRRLHAVVAEQETSYVSGSYERPNFANAQYRIAEILRDDLGDVTGAREAFRAVFENHDTSLLRDDALWQEALISPGPSACDPLGLLVAELPSSRYVACAPLLCPKLERAVRKVTDGECRNYIRRELSSEPGTSD